MSEILHNLQEKASIRIVRLFVASVTTSAAQVTDEEGNVVSYGCRGLELFNPSTTETLKYSFDNSNWRQIPPLGSIERDEYFNALYLKATGTISNVEGSFGKIQ